jgi:hypothetical protein
MIDGGPTLMAVMFTKRHDSHIASKKGGFNPPHPSPLPSSSALHLNVSKAFSQWVVQFDARGKFLDLYKEHVLDLSDQANDPSLEDASLKPVKQLTLIDTTGLFGWVPVHVFRKRSSNFNFRRIYS